jgi:KDO2-lipid IV(A) lauroyltransferase
MRPWLRPEVALWRRLAYWGARYGPWPWLRYSPPLFGLLFAVWLDTERRAVRANLRLVLGRRPAAREAWDVACTFMNFAKCLAEGLAAERPEVGDAPCRVVGIERLREAIDGRKGVILVTAHVGPWDAAARLLVKDARVPVKLVMAKEPDPVARELQDRLRSRFGVEVVHVGDSAFDSLPVLRHLRTGGAVALQLDRALAGARAIRVELFGAPFHFPEGPFRLAALSGAPVLPVFARRRAFADYELSLGRAIFLPRRPSSTELANAAERVAGELETFLRANITQWFHFERVGDAEPGTSPKGDAVEANPERKAGAGLA